MKKRILIFLVVLLVGVPLGMYAYSVSSMRSLYRAVEKKALAIVMFYRSARNQRKENRELYDALKKAQKDFASLSRVKTYKQADLQMIQANVEQKDLQNVHEELGVSIGEEPVYVPFVNGKQMQQGPTGGTLSKKGFLTIRQLRDFIDRNMGDVMQDYLDDKQERARRERAENALYFGFGGGYPWYGWYPYYGGWGYPYGGYGYGGNVGFGVSFGF